MSIRTIVSSVVLACLAWAAPASGQLRADPGTVINGLIAVRVNVTLSDEETPYAPIGGVSLRFFRTTADTTVATRTDAAGTTTILLMPGEYRLMSTSPVDWKGNRYSWSRLVQVRAGLPTIELTATVAERSAVAVEPTVPSETRSGRAAEADEMVLRKDPSMATMLSFFLAGSGQMYAGERGKGGTLLALAAVGAGVAAKQLSCATASDCKSTTGGMALGAAGMVAFFGSWIYSVMDAADAARRFNAAHNLTTVRIDPYIAPAGHGRTRFGFAMGLPR